MSEEWTPPASDKAAPKAEEKEWTPPASDRAAGSEWTPPEHDLAEQPTNAPDPKQSALNEAARSHIISNGNLFDRSNENAGKNLDSFFNGFKQHGYSDQEIDNAKVANQHLNEWGIPIKTNAQNEKPDNRWTSSKLISAVGGSLLNGLGEITQGIGTANHFINNAIGLNTPAGKDPIEQLGKSMQKTAKEVLSTDEHIGLPDFVDKVLPDFISHDVDLKAPAEMVGAMMPYFVAPEMWAEGLAKFGGEAAVKEMSTAAVKHIPAGLMAASSNAAESYNKADERIKEAKDLTEDQYIEKHYDGSVPLDHFLKQRKYIAENPEKVKGAAYLGGAMSGYASFGLPWSEAISNIDKVTDGAVRKFITNEAANKITGKLSNSSITGMMQMGTQSALQNLTAKETYDKTRKIWDGVAENGTNAMVANTVLSAFGMAIGGMEGKAKTPEGKAYMDATKAFVEEKKQSIEGLNPFSLVKEKISSPKIDELEKNINEWQGKIESGEIPDDMKAIAQRKVDAMKAEKDTESQNLRQSISDNSLRETTLKSLKSDKSTHESLLEHATEEEKPLIENKIKDIDAQIKKVSASQEAPSVEGEQQTVTSNLQTDEKGNQENGNGGQEKPSQENASEKNGGQENGTKEKVLTEPVMGAGENPPPVAENVDGKEISKQAVQLGLELPDRKDFDTDQDYVDAIAKHHEKVNDFVSGLPSGTIVAPDGTRYTVTRGHNGVHVELEGNVGGQEFYRNGERVKGSSRDFSKGFKFEPLKTEQDATKEISQQEGAKQEHSNGSESGKTAEAGSSNSVFRAAESKEREAIAAKHNSLASDIKSFNGLNKTEKKGESGKSTKAAIIKKASELGYTVGGENGKIIVLNEKGKQVRAIGETENIPEPPKEQIDHAISEIANGAINWGGDRFSPRVDFDMSWTDIRKGEKDLKEGKMSLPAKRLVREFTKAKENGGYDFVQGSGGVMDKMFVPLTEAEHKEIDERDLTHTEIESLANDYDQHFNSLSNEEKIQFSKDTEDEQDNRKPDNAEQPASAEPIEGGKSKGNAENKPIEAESRTSEKEVKENNKVMEKFIAEDIKPTVEGAKNTAKATKAWGKSVGNSINKAFFMDKVVSNESGEDVYATLVKGLSNPDARVAELSKTKVKDLLKKGGTAEANAQSELAEKTVGKLQKEFERLPKDVLKAINNSRGTVDSKAGKLIQEKAKKDLEGFRKAKPELDELMKSIKSVTDNSFEYAKQKGLLKDEQYVSDYFYGLFEDGDKVKVSDVLGDYFRSHKKFTKEKSILSPAEGQALGLRLKSDNPVTMAMYEHSAIARRVGMMDIKDKFKKDYQSLYKNTSDLKNFTALKTAGYLPIEDPVFKGMLFQPDVATFVNNVISTNKISQNPVLKGLKAATNFTRSLEFFGSLYHTGNMLKSAVFSAPLSIVDPRGYWDFIVASTREQKITPKYLKYIELGGVTHTNVEAQAVQYWDKGVDKLERGNYLGAATSAAASVIKASNAINKWQFDKMIPNLKFLNFEKRYNAVSKRLGRELTDAEMINIVKKGDRIFGEMNEKILGRSGTVTSAMRLIFNAPGYSEGNFSTLIDAAYQTGKVVKSVATGDLKGIKAQYDAGDLSSTHFVMSTLIGTLTAATLANLALGHKLPAINNMNGLRDAMKIDTGEKDKNGNKILMDQLTFGKDYLMALDPVTWTNGEWNGAKLPKDLKNRASGMLTETARVGEYLSEILLTGEARDWRGKRFVYKSDNAGEAMYQLAKQVKEEITPFTVQNYQKGMGEGVAHFGLNFLGQREDKPEAVKQEIAKKYDEIDRKQAERGRGDKPPKHHHKQSTHR